MRLDRIAMTMTNKNDLYPPHPDDPDLLKEMKAKRMSAYGKSILIFSSSVTPSLRYAWKYAVVSAYFLDMKVVCINEPSQKSLLAVIGDLGISSAVFEPDEERDAVDIADYNYIYIPDEKHFYVSPYMELFSEIMHTNKPLKVVMPSGCQAPVHIIGRNKTYCVFV